MFKYCICNETFQGWSWADTCREIARCGYRYVEVAPFTLAEDIRSLTRPERHEIRTTARSAGLEIVGLHWLLISPKGLSITSDGASVRTETAKYLAALVDFCYDIGGKTMVLGSPAQRRLPPTGHVSSERLAEERLAEVLMPGLDRCTETGVTICLEPLPAPEADFILTLSESSAIAARIAHPRLQTMLDVKSACSESEPIPALIREYHQVIMHVHVNDANRRGPGFGETDFVPILAALTESGYDGPVSVEVFDYSPDPVTIATGSLKYLQSCEPAGTVAQA